MKRKKITQAEGRKIVKAYRSNTLSEQRIQQLEEVNQISIEEIIHDLELDFDNQQYNVANMNVTTAKKLLKNIKNLTPIEIARYEQFSGCSFEDVITAAYSIISNFEERKRQLQHAKEERIKYRNNWRHAFSLDIVQEIEETVSMHFADSLTLSACTSSDFIECHFMGISPLINDSKGKKIADSLNNENDLRRFAAMLESDLKKKFGKDTELTIRSVDKTSYDCLDITVKAIEA